jgi:hypothetical protein
VAEVTGSDPTYHLARRFLSDCHRERSPDGKTGTLTFSLEEGTLYEVQPAKRGRYFVTVQGGHVVRLSENEALQRVEDLDAGREPPTGIRRAPSGERRAE